MRILITIIIFLSLQMSVYAETFYLDYKYMDKVNKERMTKKEELLVRRFASDFARVNKNNSEVNIIFNAIKIITDRCDYSLEGKKPYNVLSGSGNCQAYSTMFQILLTKLNIETEVIVNPEHMWNRVKLNAEWIEIDVTASEVLLKGGAKK